LLLVWFFKFLDGSLNNQININHQKPNPMKNFVLVLLFFLTNLLVYSQKVVKFEEMKKHGLSMEKLNSIYRNALPGSDTVTKVDLFSEKFFEDTIQPSWRNIVKGMISDVTTKDPSLKGIKVWQRMYFDTSGSVDYFVFHFKTKNLSTKEQKKFERLVTKFLKKKKPKLVRSLSKYSLCSGIAL